MSDVLDVALVLSGQDCRFAPVDDAYESLYTTFAAELMNREVVLRLARKAARLLSIERQVVAERLVSAIVASLVWKGHVRFRLLNSEIASAQLPEFTALRLCQFRSECRVLRNALLDRRIAVDRMGTFFSDIDPFPTGAADAVWSRLVMAAMEGVGWSGPLSVLRTRCQQARHSEQFAKLRATLCGTTEDALDLVAESSKLAS